MKKTNYGKVYLVGAGPGDEKLITVKGLELIKKADVIVYDYLVNSNLLKLAKNSCEKIYVGKKAGNHTLSQKEINNVLVKYAKAGKNVLRLKGGDPYVFGRGGEEGEELFNNNIDFEVVPGISSSIGGLTYAGIPITHRNYASSFHVITGHRKEGYTIDYKSISNLDGTIVFLMGVKNLNEICTNLIKYGKNPNTPVALIYMATTTLQKTVTGTLKTIEDVVNKNKIKSPSLIVVGEVVKLRNKLSFFEKKPLFNKNIVVTRAKKQAFSMISKIKELGGNVIECPSIKVKQINEKDLKKSINNLNKYSHLIFTSTNAVNIFFKKLFEEKKDSRSLNGLKITAIGDVTAKELNKYGIYADFIPPKFVGEELVDLLKSKLCLNDRILIPRSKGARDYLVKELSKICKVEEINIYETIIGEGNNNIIKLLHDKNIDYITFSSPSIVDNFIKLINEENLHLLKYTKIISIGPITSSRIKDYGLKVFQEANPYTTNGIINCILSNEGKNQNV